MATSPSECRKHGAGHQQTDGSCVLCARDRRWEAYEEGNYQGMSREWWDMDATELASSVEAISEDRHTFEDSKDFLMCLVRASWDRGFESGIEAARYMESSRNGRFSGPYITIQDMLICRFCKGMETWHEKDCPVPESED